MREAGPDEEGTRVSCQDFSDFSLILQQMKP